MGNYPGRRPSYPHRPALTRRLIKIHKHLFFGPFHGEIKYIFVLDRIGSTLISDNKNVVSWLTHWRSGPPSVMKWLNGLLFYHMKGYVRDIGHGVRFTSDNGTAIPASRAKAGARKTKR